MCGKCNERIIQRYWFEPIFKHYLTVQTRYFKWNRLIIQKRKIFKPTADAGTFLAQAVNTNIHENHTKKCHICKKRTFEQNHQILTSAATIAMNETRLKVIQFKSQMKKNQKSLLGTQFSEVWRKWKSKNEAFEEVVYCHKNVFMVLKGNADGKPLNNIAMKAIHFMITLLLQNPSKYSNAKDHLKGLKK